MNGGDEAPVHGVVHRVDRPQQVRMPSSAGRAALGSVAVAWILLLPALVHGQSRSARLVYEAPPECPGADTFVSRVAERIGYVPFQPDASDLVHVALSTGPEGVRARLQFTLGGTTSHRVLDGEGGDCDALVTTAALTTSLALDPMAAMPAPGSPPPEAPRDPTGPPEEAVPPAPQAPPAPRAPPSQAPPSQGPRRGGAGFTVEVPWPGWGVRPAPPPPGRDVPSLPPRQPRRHAAGAHRVDERVAERVERRPTASDRGPEPGTPSRLGFGTGPRLDFGLQPGPLSFGWSALLAYEVDRTVRVGARTGVSFPSREDRHSGWSFDIGAWGCLRVLGPLHACLDAHLGTLILSGDDGSESLPTLGVTPALAGIFDLGDHLWVRVEAGLRVPLLRHDVVQSDGWTWRTPDVVPHVGLALVIDP